VKFVLQSLTVLIPGRDFSGDFLLQRKISAEVTENAETTEEREDFSAVEKAEAAKPSVYKGKNHWAARASTYRMIVPLGKSCESR